VDTEASIRTNTTIFFGKIAGQLQPSTRLRMIVPVFLRGMKDPFPYARLAAVRATSACKSFYDTGLIVGKVFEFMWIKERLVPCDTTCSF
jgi:SCY1-like protein 1